MPDLIISDDSASHILAHLGRRLEGFAPRAKPRRMVSKAAFSAVERAKQANENIRIDLYEDVAHAAAMELIQIYECFCDVTRLRIIHLLTRGPLCVCHFQEILDVPQVKVSQHLAYLRKRGMVEATRHANWMIYRLPAEPGPELEANLKCLQDCTQTDPRFLADLARLETVKAASEWVAGALQDKAACRC